MKKIAIYGMGAIGGLLAARLAATGAQVAAVARGATLHALQQYGARVVIPGTHEMTCHPLLASSDPAALGVQDVVIVTVKAPALIEVAARIAPLIGPDTIILSAMNGVPWWFFEPPGVPLHGARLQSLDGDGFLAQSMPWQHVVGCVVHLSAASPQPGVVQLATGNRLIIGEPAGGSSERVAELAHLLTRAGFETEQSAAIRSDIWYKLWGNMTMNPISAMTGATGDRVLDDVLVRRFCLSVMQEAAAIGAKIGCPIAQSGEDRMNITRKLGAFRTSMLQDVTARKPLELDALLGVVHEIGELIGMHAPNIATLFGLTRLFGRCHQLYPD